MFAIVQNGIIIMYLQPGTAWTYNGVQYPPQWIAQATAEQKAELGIVDVVYGPQANQQYYWVGENPPVYNAQTNTVNINYTATPKDLDPLKVQQAAQINQTAYTILLPTDWMVVKAIETQGTVDPDWNTWRQSIRTTADTARAAVEACTTVAELANLPSIQWPLSPEQLAQQAAQEAQQAAQDAENVVEESAETPPQG
jgi:hypothetical protein